MKKASEEVIAKQRAIYARHCSFGYWEYMRKMDMNAVWYDPNYGWGYGIQWNPKTGDRFDSYYKENYNAYYKFYFDTFKNKFYDADKNLLMDPIYHMPLPKTDWYIYGAHEGYMEQGYTYREGTGGK